MQIAKEKKRRTKRLACALFLGSVVWWALSSLLAPRALFSLYYPIDNRTNSRHKLNSLFVHSFDQEGQQLAVLFKDDGGSNSRLDIINLPNGSTIGSHNLAGNYFANHMDYVFQEGAINLNDLHNVQNGDSSCSIYIRGFDISHHPCIWFWNLQTNEKKIVHRSLIPSASFASSDGSSICEETPLPLSYLSCLSPPFGVFSAVSTSLWDKNHNLGGVTIYNFWSLPRREKICKIVVSSPTALHEHYISANGKWLVVEQPSSSDSKTFGTSIVALDTATGHKVYESPEYRSATVCNRRIGDILCCSYATKEDYEKIVSREGRMPLSRHHVYIHLPTATRIPADDFLDVIRIDEVTLDSKTQSLLWLPSTLAFQGPNTLYRTNAGQTELMLRSLDLGRITDAKLIGNAPQIAVRQCHEAKLPEWLTNIIKTFFETGWDADDEIAIYDYNDQRKLWAVRLPHEQPAEILTTKDSKFLVIHRLLDDRHELLLFKTPLVYWSKWWPPLCGVFIFLIITFALRRFERGNKVGSNFF